MQETYPLRVADDHLLITIGGLEVLLDSGAPTSFGEAGAVQILGNRYPVQPSYMGLEAHMLEQHLGVPVDILLGADLMGQHFVRVDRARGEAAFSTERRSTDGICVPVDTFMGIPYVNLGVGAESLNAFLDTGAKLSYLPSSITSSLSSQEVVSDFYPMVGEFETPVFELQATLAGETFPLRAGSLPTLLQMSLMLGGVQGILGSDLFRHFGVTFALAEDAIYLEPLRAAPELR